MQNEIKNLINNLFSKTSFVFILVHWMLVFLGVYQRGGWYLRPHFNYEPLISQFVILIDIPALAIAESSIMSFYELIDQGYPLTASLGYFTIISIQWLLIGAGVNEIFFSKLKHKSNVPKHI